MVSYTDDILGIMREILEKHPDLSMVELIQNLTDSGLNSREHSPDEDQKFYLSLLEYSIHLDCKSNEELAAFFRQVRA